MKVGAGMLGNGVLQNGVLLLRVSSYPRCCRSDQTRLTRPDQNKPNAIYLLMFLTCRVFSQRGVSELLAKCKSQNGRLGQIHSAVVSLLGLNVNGAD